MRRRRSKYYLNTTPNRPQEVFGLLQYVRLPEPCVQLTPPWLNSDSDGDRVDEQEQERIVPYNGIQKGAFQSVKYMYNLIYPICCISVMLARSPGRRRLKTTKPKRRCHWRLHPKLLFPPLLPLPLPFLHPLLPPLLQKSPNEPPLLDSGSLRPHPFKRCSRLSRFRRLRGSPMSNKLGTTGYRFCPKRASNPWSGS